MAYNLAAIQQLVTAAFSDDELKSFCFARFSAVYQDFTAGQTQGQRVLLLAEYAKRQGQLDTLLDAVRQANPYQYERFEADLRSESGKPDFERKPFEPETILTPAVAKIDTGGGAFVGESVNTGGGRFIGRDEITNEITIIVSTPDQAVTLSSRLQRQVELLQPELETKSFEPKTVLIPTGPFLMGSDESAGREDERPQHTVTLPDFRIGKFPVTNAQYAEFIRREKTQDVPKDAGWFLREPPADRLDHPVVNVSWYDAVAYCQWLCRETGRRYRLPTEAEWEKAASWGGGDRERGREGEGERKCHYPWGDDWQEDRCNVGGAGTTPVTAHPTGSSAYGCEDMLGNVQEWTATLWGTQPGQPQQSYRDRPDGGPAITDPADLPAGARLAHRGGSFKSQPGELRCSARGSAAPDSRIPWRGCRVAMEG